jgi:hypothetical protein
MAYNDIRQKAIELRKKGESYNAIKTKLHVSKSTLSRWLYSLPLSEERLRELQADSPVRIERYRNTMRKKKEVRLGAAYEEMAKKIGILSSRELFLSGLFLYWAEGTKTREAGIELTNTNPSMLKFVMAWLTLLGVPMSKMKVHLHLYADMNIKKQMKFWSKILGLPLSQFRKPYIKNTSLLSLTYKNGFGQGTCSILVGDVKLSNRVLMGIKYIQEIRL